MSLVIGIDIGTSGVKAVIADENESVRGEASQPIRVSAPHPGWSEQAPDLWCEAVATCLDALAAAHPVLIADVAGIGLSGQMLGTVMIDTADRPVRPAALWNDQRAIAESAELLRRQPDIGHRTNGTPDPGLPGPKLLWFAAHEPEALEATDCLLSPKDYVRLWLTGTRATEASDASGTCLMDNRTGAWSDDLIAACGWSAAKLPPLIGSAESGGGLRASLATRFGMRSGIPVAGGAGDNMACSLGVGAAAPGDTVVTIGTSAVVCAVDAAFRPAPDDAILTGIHAAPGTYLSMAVVMSATATFQWLADITRTPVPELAAEAEAFAAQGRIGEAPTVAPALGGIRTPHNRPDAAAIIGGLTGRTDRSALAYATLEGIAFQIAECVEAQARAGLTPDAFTAVGGGARNAFWLSLLATLFARPVSRSATAPLAAPLGAARLARIAAGAADLASLRDKPAAEIIVEPDTPKAAPLAERFDRYRALLDSQGYRHPAA
ncbi:xylulokinase [Acuticoccus sp. MNP-M23]|uniref:xylulokinase n=1 Tax=Acuticoccus sp. MNP-M23 TaxID=3072793 RepID=UPI002816835B|nr:xylulokinase [Acuticoccus sp. MNP-M23]WMS43050.1 xylulokinase [Acuticoccus sp. MNP-M23]